MQAIFIYLFVALYVHLISAACPSSTYRDSYSSLPAAPTFPTQNITASFVPPVTADNPLTFNHWSEKANLAAYRPPKITPIANPPQTNCPHLQANLLDWHNPATWAGSSVPANGAQVNIPENTSVLISSCSIDPTWVFGTVNIPASSTLIFGDAVINVQATGFNVSGSLLIGSETCRLRNKISITLHGVRGALPASNPWVKGMAVYGNIDIHGARYFPTWTRLAMTAKPNDSWIFIQDVVNWQIGQRIVIATTELKDARDWHRNEERTITDVKLTTLGQSVSAIKLDEPLSYLHFGGSEYQAEVALLSRNILIQGDPTNSYPTDTANKTCVDNNNSTYPCEMSYLTGFGAHIIVIGAGTTASGRFSGVEMFRVGQTNTLGRYPIHFHLLGNRTANNYTTAYVQDSSVHDSFFRCFAIHGTSGARLSENTAYNAIGHCYFLEDGVEEDNIIEYNQAAFVHALGPYVNPSIGANGDSFGSQYLSYYNQSATLLLPSDMAAGCFYITNTYNDFVGNAASGGWSGYAMPSLPKPVKLHASVNNTSPQNRPFRSPFRGNSAHSSGYWFLSAGGIYVGGTLTQYPDGTLTYTSGRSNTHETCFNRLVGTPSGPTGCAAADLAWLRFEDNKVFLSNRGMQHWGTRSEIIRFELHDVSLAMNVFGKVWIDNLLMECRTTKHRTTWLNGCLSATAEPKAPAWGKCNVRDYTFYNTLGGFQWYDVGQQHILTNSIFRNCRQDWNRCIYGPSTGLCSNGAVFTSLTHSDQFVPDQMQVTNNLSYQNTSDLWRFSTKLTDATGVTVSGRLQNWYDVDGSASKLGVRAMIGSAWANDWWKYNSNCSILHQAWRCPMAADDAAGSFVIKTNAAQEARIGVDLCANGGGKVSCPVVATVSHFGSTNESAGLLVGVNAKVTGPIIAKAGGWFIRYAGGTPNVLNITSMQVNETKVLLLAIPYPAGTTFNIWYQGASWCNNPTTQACQHPVRSVSSIAAVRESFGDAYYWNNAARLLYVRAVQSKAYWGSKNAQGSQDPAIWGVTFPDDMFVRGGQTMAYASSATIVIKASCTVNPCAPQNDVPVPAALFPGGAPTPAPTVGTGLTGRYFNGSGFNTAGLVRVDSTINFDWAKNASAPGITADWFSVRWTGSVMPQYSQVYTFYLRSDDGGRVYVAGQTLVNNWVTGQNYTEKSGSIYLMAGVRYQVLVEYFDSTLFAGVQLSWSSASVPKAIIPTSRLYPL